MKITIYINLLCHYLFYRTYFSCNNAAIVPIIQYYYICIKFYYIDELGKSWWICLWKHVSMSLKFNLSLKQNSKFVYFVPVLSFFSRWNCNNNLQILINLQRLILLTESFVVHIIIDKFITFYNIWRQIFSLYR